MIALTKGPTVIHLLRRLALPCLLALGTLAATPAEAVIRIDITGGSVQPLPIAIPEFVASNPQATPDGALQTLSTRISQVLSDDLKNSGLFRPLDKAAFTTTVTAENFATPDYASWRTIAAQALVTGYAKLNADGSMAVGCYLFDVFSEEGLLQHSVTIATPKQWRRAAHKCADKIYTQLTGDSGYFDTRIAYIAETGPRKNRVKRLAIMDQDGANIEYLTTGQNLALTPRFAPDGGSLSYLAFGATPRVFRYDLTTRRQELLGRFPNMSFAPRYAPDGRSIALTLSENGDSDIYILDLASKQTRRITNQPSIDTSPSFSPDGQRIVFESNRGGSQQLYVMNADGSGAQRISFDTANPRARYGSPVWSPRGDLIAFTKIANGKLRIGVMRPDGSGERLLTDSWQDEAPAWSPNGRVITFFRTQRSTARTDGGVAVHAIDLTGVNERRIPTPTDSSDPNWSPLLP
ncbi:MAG: Tol-Pal system protein TolB [Sphingomonadales bacterium]|nr:MAG: Tol-Pal system protein TolB [Sphingomonadales bacterium]